MILLVLIFCLQLQSLCLQGASLDDQTPEKWNEMAEQKLHDLLNRKSNKNIAKNIILFVGDGMSIGTGIISHQLYSM